MNRLYPLPYRSDLILHNSNGSGNVGGKPHDDVILACDYVPVDEIKLLDRPNC